MPICGCWPAVISDRGAFGFSNDKSLMYCATTLSCGCVSSAGASAGPPLVVLMKSPVRGYLSASVGRTAARGWLTQGPEGDKDCGQLRFTAAVAPVGQLPIRHAAPLLGRQIDHAVGARAWAGAAKRRRDRPAQRRDEQQQAHDVGDK